MNRRKIRKFIEKLLAALATLAGFLIDVFEIDGIWTEISIILVVGGVVASISLIIADFLNNNVMSKEKMIQIGKTVLLNTSELIVLYGGDISWANDYADAISSLVSEHKTVDVVYPENRKDESKLQILRAAGANIYSIPQDMGFRFMISDPDSRNSVVFLASKVRREINNTRNSGLTKYKANVYTYRDELVFDSFEQINKLITKTRVADKGTSTQQTGGPHA